MIEKIEVMITPFNLKRTLHIYLPYKYNYSKESYPVMYYFDGHNLFDDKDATYGTSWGLKDFLDNYDKPFIVVGIECNHQGNERLSEFCPYSYRGIKGKGKEFMKWVVEELKPFIDSKYRTIPFRETTGIAGSSMGGLMALYTLIAHNDIFSKAACLSSAIYSLINELDDEFYRRQLSPDSRCYLSFGENEAKRWHGLDNSYRDNNHYADLWKSKGATALVYCNEDGEHSEASWAKESEIYYDFLWKAK